MFFSVHVCKKRQKNRSVFNGSICFSVSCVLPAPVLKRKAQFHYYEFLSLISIVLYPNAYACVHNDKPHFESHTVKNTIIIKHEFIVDLCGTQRWKNVNIRRTKKWLSITEPNKSGKFHFKIPVASTRTNEHMCNS